MFLINYIHRALFESPLHHRVEVRSSTALFLIIQRCDFDTALINLAQVSGTIAVQGASVVGMTVSGNQVSVVCGDGREFVADLVIGADGVRFRVAR